MNTCIPSTYRDACGTIFLSLKWYSAVVLQLGVWGRRESPGGVLGRSPGKKMYFRPSRHLETAHFQHLEIAIPALPTSHYVVSMKMILILHL